jgi:hypothetical protein
MCDFSLHNVKSRPAKVGDKLTTHSFYTAGGFHNGGLHSPGNGTRLFRGGDMCTVRIFWVEEENNKFQDGDLSTNQQGRTTGASRRTRIPGWYVCSPDVLA